MNKVERDFIDQFLELRRRLTSIIFYNIGKPNDKKSIWLADAASQSVLLTLFSARFNEYLKGNHKTLFYQYKGFFEYIKDKTPSKMIDTTSPVEPIFLNKNVIRKIVPFQTDQVDKIFDGILYFDGYKSLDPFFFLSRLSEGMISYRASFLGSRVSFSIKNEWRSGTGSFFTPQDVSEFVVDGLWSKSNKKLDQLFIDPTCGTGNLVIAYVKKLLTKFKPQDVVKAVESYVYGCDTNIKSLEILRYSLWNICFRYSKNPDIGKNLFHQDFLKFNKNIKFDICASNPPFVSMKGRILHTEISQKALSIIKPDGVCCLILPASVCTSSKYSFFRDDLLDLNASIDVLSFDIMPSSLFDQLKYEKTAKSFSSSISARASIFFLNMMKGVKGKIRTTRMIRFKKSERDQVFKNNKIPYCTVPRKMIKKLGVIPHISFDKELTLMDKIVQYKPISDYLADKEVPGVGYIEVNSISRYFLYASMGKSVSNSAKFRLYPKTKRDYYNLYCYINSNIVYWYWRKMTESTIITKSFIKSVPIPILEESSAKIYAMRLKKNESKCIFSRAGRKNVNFNRVYDVLSDIDRKFLGSMRSATLWNVVKKSKANSLFLRDYPF